MPFPLFLKGFSTDTHSWGSVLGCCVLGPRCPHGPVCVIRALASATAVQAGAGSEPRELQESVAVPRTELEGLLAP